MYFLGSYFLNRYPNYEALDTIVILCIALVSFSVAGSPKELSDRRFSTTHLGKHVYILGRKKVGTAILQSDYIDGLFCCFVLCC